MTRAVNAPVTRVRHPGLSSSADTPIGITCRSPSLPKPLTTGMVVAVSITSAASATIRLVEVIARFMCFTSSRAFAAARLEGGANGSVTAGNDSLMSTRR